jgi:hypothetical protein
LYEAQADLIQSGYTPTPGGEITGGGRWFLATVTDTSRKAIFVIPRDDTGYILDNPLKVATKQAGKFSPGDTVLIAYDDVIINGSIESPLQIIKDNCKWNVFSTTALGMALYDVDQDGKEELCGLGYGPTSGLFTFEVTVWEDGELDHFGCFCTQFYYLSFVEDESGPIRIQGITQGDSPETLYFDMAAAKGTVQLTCNGEPLNFWGPLS